VADLEADAPVALLAPGAVRVEGAGGHAEASVANQAGRARFGGAADFRNPDTALASCWHSGEPWWTLASLGLVLGRADRVGSA
jgi:hypothetical protein